MAYRAVYNILSSDATLTAVIPATRMYRTQAPQKPTQPYLVMRRDDVRPLYALSGYNTLTRAEFTIIGVASSIATIESVDAKIRSALRDKAPAAYGGVTIDSLLWLGQSGDTIEVAVSGGESYYYESYTDFAVWYHTS